MINLNHHILQYITGLNWTWDRTRKVDQSATVHERQRPRVKIDEAPEHTFLPPEAGGSSSVVSDVEIVADARHKLVLRLANNTIRIILAHLRRRIVLSGLV